MSHTWIVGLDGSDGSIAALRWAAGVASRRGERVRPVATWSVALPVWARSGMRAITIDRDAYRRSVEAAALEALEQVDHGDVIDEPQLVEGNAEDVLTGMAGSQTVLVVGRRGSGGLRKRVLGSVSHYVVTHAAGPVVVVPHGWASNALDHVVVGYDGSRHADAAAQWAVTVAADEARVTALIAIDVVPGLPPDVVEQRHPDLVEQQRSEVLAALDRIDPDQRLERSVQLHGPRHALADAVVEADLVAVGPRGRGAVARAVLGSTTTWLLHDAQCPVAVVPSR